MTNLMIDICLCTHNPRLDILKKVLTSIQNQSVDKKLFSLLIVDNASVQRLDGSLITELMTHGISARIIYEPLIGLQFARIAAVKNTCHDWILWVDDDNELDADFIKNGVDFINNQPGVGCFGGKLLLPESMKPSQWISPFLPYLGIREAGESVIIKNVDKWTEAEPPGAGAWVHRKVLDAYLIRSNTDSNFFQLGRVGSQGLASCDDSIMMRGAFYLGLSCAYVPSLLLYHYLDIRRFKFKYLLRLMFGYGKSHVLLMRLLDGEKKFPNEYRHFARFIWFLLKSFKGGVNQSPFFGIGMAAYHLGARSEYFRQFRKP